jgi:hypothetical protein
LTDHTHRFAHDEQYLDFSHQLTFCANKKFKNQ